MALKGSFMGLVGTLVTLVAMEGTMVALGRPWWPYWPEKGL